MLLFAGIATNVYWDAPNNTGQNRIKATIEPRVARPLIVIYVSLRCRRILDWINDRTRGLWPQARNVCRATIAGTASFTFSAPVLIYGNAGQQDQQTYRAIGRIRGDGAGHDARAGQHEGRRGVRMSRRAIDTLEWTCHVPAAEDEQRRRGESERNEVHRYHVVQDLLITSRNRDHRGEDALQHDRHYRRSRTRR